MNGATELPLPQFWAGDRYGEGWRSLGAEKLLLRNENSCNWVLSPRKAASTRLIWTRPHAESSQPN